MCTRHATSKGRDLSGFSGSPEPRLARLARHKVFGGRQNFPQAEPVLNQQILSSALGFLTACRGINGEKREDGSAASGGGRGARGRGRTSRAQEEERARRPHSWPRHDDRRLRQSSEASQASAQTP